MAKDILVVGSKVKAYVKKKGCMSSGDLLAGLSDQVHALIAAACKRTKSNKRSTVRAPDL